MDEQIQLTPEEEEQAQLLAWSKKWIKNAMSTEAMTEEDRDRARRAVCGMYAAEGLQPPIVVFVQSPLVGAFAAGFAAAILHTNAHPPIAGANATALDRRSGPRRLRLPTQTAIRAAGRRAIDAGLGEMDETQTKPGRTTREVIDATFSDNNGTLSGMGSPLSAANYYYFRYPEEELFYPPVSRRSSDYPRQSWWAVDLEMYEHEEGWGQRPRFVRSVGLSKEVNNTIELALNPLRHHPDKHDGGMEEFEEILGVGSEEIEENTNPSRIVFPRTPTETVIIDSIIAATDFRGPGFRGPLYNELRDGLAPWRWPDSRQPPVNADTRDAIYAATRTAVSAATETSSFPGKLEASRQAKLDEDPQVPSFISGFCDMRGLADELGIGEFGLKCVKAAWGMYAGGNGKSDECSGIWYYTDVARLPLDFSKFEHWRTLCEVSGPRWMHPKFCIISDRPELLLVDDAWRPHSANGPFCRWRDGTALHAWRGSWVPAAWVNGKMPSITEALTSTSGELRRIACEMIGWSNVLSQVGATIIDADGDPQIGTLLKAKIPDFGDDRAVPGSEDCLFLKVTCGTGREFIIPVPPNMTTALQANAWTYGLEPQDFTLEVRT